MLNKCRDTINATFPQSEDIGTWQYEIKSKEFKCDGNFEKILGFDKGTFPSNIDFYHSMILDEYVEEVESKLQSSILNEIENYEIDFNILTKDKTSLWIRQFCYLEKSDTGTPLVLRGVMRNYTQVELRYTQYIAEAEHNEQVANLSGLGKWDIDYANDTIYFDQCFLNELGYENKSHSDSISCLEKYVHKDDYGRLTKQLHDFLNSNNGVTRVDFRCKNIQNQCVWFRCVASIVSWDESGNPTMLRCGIFNVDNEVRAKHMLQEAIELKDEYAGKLKDEIRKAVGYLEENKKTTSAMIEASPQMNILFNSQMEAIDCNPKSIDFFGFDSKETLLANIIDFFNKNLQNYTSGGEKIPSFKEVFNRTIREEYCEINIEIKLSNTIKPLYATTKRIPYENSYAVVLYINRRNPIDERIKKMVDSMPIRVDFVDSDCQMVDCNLEAVRQSGFSSKEEYLYNYSQTIDNKQPDGRSGEDVMKQMIEKVLNEGKVIFNFVYKQKGGIRIPTEVTMVRVKYNNTYIVSIYARDLRQLQKTEKRLKYKSKLLDSVNKIATSFNTAQPELFEKTINESLKEIAQTVRADQASIWKYHEDEYDGKCQLRYSWTSEGAYECVDMPKEIDFSTVPNFANMILNGENINGCTDNMPVEEKSLLENLQIRSLLLIPIKVKGKTWGFIEFDVFGKKRHFSKVETKVLESAGLFIASAVIRKETYNNLVRAKEDALESAQAKSEFLSRMSHEIRTPMNAILGMIALAKKSKDLEVVSNYMNKADSSSKQLLEIINDVLDMSKINANKLEIQSEPFDFERMLESIYNMMEHKLVQGELNFRYNIEQTLKRYMISDELRITQVLVNLLSNAIKFTPKGGLIQVNVSSTPVNKDTSRLHIEVIDTGIGVSKENVPKLFDSFEQIDGSITRKYGGTGLGLPICKSIIELMDGNIWVESELGKGSSFIFEFDVRLGNELPIYEKYLKLPKNLNILVANDSQIELEYCKNLFHNLGYDCDVVESERDAITAILDKQNAGAPYDFIFIDWFIPESGGRVAVDKITNVIESDAMIVMFSPAEWDDVKSEMEGVNINQFIQRPLLPSKLIQSLSDSINKSNDKLEKAIRTLNQGELSGKTILLAEDIEINREILSAMMEEYDVDIQMAEDGVEAVNKFKNDPDKYDLILMDIQMPKLDGIRATKEIRDLDYNWAKDIPIIAMTANAFVEDQKRCINAGMNAHIAKPIEMKTLLGVLKDYLVCQ